MHLQSLTDGTRAGKTSASSAVTAAEEVFGLQDSQLDSDAGVVHARVLPGGVPSVDRAYIVTFDAPSYGHAPLTWHTLFRKLCVVVDADTGKVQYAYQADPSAW